MTGRPYAGSTRVQETRRSSRFYDECRTEVIEAARYVQRCVQRPGFSSNCAMAPARWTVPLFSFLWRHGLLLIQSTGVSSLAPLLGLPTCDLRHFTAEDATSIDGGFVNRVVHVWIAYFKRVAFSFSPPRGDLTGKGVPVAPPLPYRDKKLPV